MNLTAQIAKHVRDVHFGGNWTSVNMKDSLQSVTWQQATTNVLSFNKIAALVFHANYFVAAALQVLEGGALDAKDIYSFNLPPINSQADWDALLNKTWTDAEKFASLIEQMPEEKLWNDFWENKYGNFYYNLHGTIEHIHYHLGQIVLIKKALS